ncbi:MAG: 4Fe-4S dicluster domain-containing protein, partial [Hyphomicrobiales bacterium]
MIDKFSAGYLRHETCASRDASVLRFVATDQLDLSGTPSHPKGGHVPHVINQSCCNDAACVSACPVDCIHPSPGEVGYGTTEMLFIDPSTCVDCGACVDVCPVDAITRDSELSPQELPFLELNRLHYASRSYPRRDLPLPVPRLTVEQREPLRVAVVGAGPAALFSVESILSRRGLDATVSVYERLPVPFGLVRSGVAPDHVRTKQVVKQFERTASRRGVTFHFNTEVGRDITHEQLVESHHAVLYAVGAPSDRALGIPGEELTGSHAATQFVGWYNGHPDHAHREFDLSHPRAVVVGNGNVALDVARVLVSDIDRLRRTDMSSHALEVLAESRVEEVVVIGRRGVAQAAYTTKELIELGHLPGVDVLADPREVRIDPISQSQLERAGSEALRFKTEIAERYARNSRTPGRRSIVLRYLTSPTAIDGDEGVKSIRVAHNRLVETTEGTLTAVPTGTTETLDCGLVLRSVGYRGEPVSGVEFDRPSGRIPNVSGRVVDSASGEQVVGVYTAGWIKRGPSGVIGTNKTCAKETVDAIVDDYFAGKLKPPVRDEPTAPESSFGWE